MKFKLITSLSLTCVIAWSNLTIEALEQGVKYVQG